MAQPSKGDTSHLHAFHWLEFKSMAILRSKTAGGCSHLSIKSSGPREFILISIWQFQPPLDVEKGIDVRLNK